MANIGLNFGTKSMEIETNLFNKETIYTNCTVQVWENTITGEVSVGWFPNEGCEEITQEE